MIPLQFLIQRRIISLPANISAHLAAKTLCDSDVGCLLVTGPRGELVGIATDRDLACSVLGEKQDTEIPLFDVMTANPLTVEASADLEEVIHVMEEGGIRRVPVVKWEDGEAHCIGLISLDDLIASKLVDSDRLARIVRSQIQRLKELPLRGASDAGKDRAATMESDQRSHSLNEFYRNIQAETGLADQELLDVSDEILEAIVRRLHYTGAAHFISHLDGSLRERLLTLPAGPDPKMTRSALVDTLRSHHGYSSGHASQIIGKFVKALQKLLPQAEIPEDFSSPESGVGKETQGDAA